MPVFREAVLVILEMTQYYRSGPELAHNMNSTPEYFKHFFQYQVNVLYCDGLFNVAKCFRRHAHEITPWHIPCRPPYR